jgi:hypothetical protein
MIMGHPTVIGWQGEQLLATPVVGHQTRPQASGRLGLLLRSPASLLGCSAWVLVGLFRPRGRGLPTATSAATSDSLRLEDLAARRRWVNALGLRP